MEPNPWVVEQEFDDEPTYVAREKDDGESNDCCIAFGPGISPAKRRAAARLVANFLNEIGHLSDEAIAEFEQVKSQQTHDQPCKCNACGHIGWGVVGLRCGACGVCNGIMVMA